jgi:hypothetical protein
VSARVSRLLGGGGAPARAFGGGAAMVATAGPRVACMAEFLLTPDSPKLRCALECGHADKWHRGGGWIWDDDGRFDRAPRVGR